MNKLPSFEVPLVARPYQGTFRISSPFGVYEKVRNGRIHTGIDFAMPEGTPLFACFSGEALFRTKEDGNGAGNRIHIFDYKRGIKASYFHMKDFVMDIKTKAVVEGELLGWSGNTGHSSGPHLHFEIRRLRDAAPIHPYFKDEYTEETVKKMAPYGMPED
jgi:murein DD-endopeptidase MepM/ murein hydrolase activator NlpD